MCKMSEDNVVDLEKYRKKSVKFGFCGFNKHLEQEIKDKKEQVKHYLNTLPLDRKMEMAFRGLCELYDSIFLQFLDRMDEDYVRHNYFIEMRSLELIKEGFEKNKNDIRYLERSFDLVYVVFETYEEAIKDYKERYENHPDEDIMRPTICEVYALFFETTDVLKTQRK